MSTLLSKRYGANGTEFSIKIVSKSAQHWNRASPSTSPQPATLSSTLSTDVTVV